MSIVYLYRKIGGSVYPSSRVDLVAYLESLKDAAAVEVSVRGEEVWTSGKSFLAHGDEAFIVAPLVAETSESTTAAPLHSHIFVTTETASAIDVEERLGIVSSRCVHGMNIVKDLLASARDFFGGRSETVEKGLRDATETAIDELKQQAHKLGADGVVGVQVSNSNFATAGATMVVVAAFGTAVKLRKNS